MMKTKSNFYSGYVSLLKNLWVGICPHIGVYIYMSTGTCKNLTYMCARYPNSCRHRITATGLSCPHTSSGIWGTLMHLFWS